MNEVTSSTTTTTDLRQFKPKSILRNSKSSPALGSHHKSSTSAGGSPKSNHLKPSGRLSNKFSSIIHRFTASCTLFLEKVRNISEEVFSLSETVREYFESSDRDDSRLEKLTKANKGYNSEEERFIKEYKTTQSLERMYQVRQQQQREVAGGSPPPVPPKLMLLQAQATNEHRVSLREVIRQTSGDGDSSSTLNPSYHELDVCEMRKELEASPALDNTSTPSPSFLSSSESSSSPVSNTDVNIGEALWNYRRAKWLSTEKSSQEIEARANQHLLDALPRELQVKIYTNLVNKGKTLKEDKRLNLQDLVAVINAGWIAEDKWERAAKGLA